MYNEYPISGDAPTCPRCDSDLARGVCLRCLRRNTEARAVLGMMAVRRPECREDALHNHEVLVEEYQALQQGVA